VEGEVDVDAWVLNADVGDVVGVAQQHWVLAGVVRLADVEEVTGVGAEVQVDTASSSR
jgi:hypothetical protein